MKTGNSKFTAFLDNRFIPLKSTTKLFIVVALILLPAVVFYFSFFKPKSDQTAGLVNQKNKLTQELKEVKQKSADLAKFEKELAAAEEEFNRTSILLPKEKEIPKLLTDISALGTNAGLDFLTFKPLSDIPKDFYKEIPIDINVRGPYHNMGYFFDQVSKLDRIVTVSNVRMGAPKKDRGEMLLNSDCKLVTYQFTNVELPKQDNKKNKKK
jgi:type IV pilus assembly protein PilO